MSRVHRNDAIDGLLHRFAGLGSPLEDDEGLLEALGPLLERAAEALREAEPRSTICAAKRLLRCF